MIRKSSGGYTVYARSGRKMGTYRTKAEADARRAQLEAFKAMRVTAPPFGSGGRSHGRAQRSPTSELRGKRIQLHPGTDQWMMGDRYGPVTRANKDGTLQVKMDRSGKSLRVRRDHVGEWL